MVLFRYYNYLHFEQFTEICRFYAFKSFINGAAKSPSPNVYDTNYCALKPLSSEDPLTTWIIISIF